MRDHLHIKDETGYQIAVLRYEEIRNAAKDSPKRKEWLFLALLINHYEERDWKMPFIDQVELSQIRNKDFGYPGRQKNSHSV